MAGNQSLSRHSCLPGSVRAGSWGQEPEAGLELRCSSTGHGHLCQRHACLSMQWFLNHQHECQHLIKNKASALYIKSLSHSPRQATLLPEAEGTLTSTLLLEFEYRGGYLVSSWEYTGPSPGSTPTSSLLLLCTWQVRAPLAGSLTPTQETCVGSPCNPAPLTVGVW